MIYNTPDGPVNFPDTMTEDEVKAVLRKKFPPPVTAQPGFQFDEMLANLGPSAKQAGSNIAQAVMNPLDTAAAVGKSLVGGIQNVRDKLPTPLQYTAPFALAMGADVLGADYRPEADAVGEALAARYGGKDELLNTLETDPVGAGLDVAGLFGAAAPATAARLNPITRAASAVLDRTARGVMGSAAKFSKLNSVADNDMMVDTMLREGINPSGGGVRKLEGLIERQGAIVDDLIAQADASGKGVSIYEVLKPLQALKSERGGSLVGGAEDIAKINQFTLSVVENAQRLGKTTLDASDLQKLKRGLYDQIAWNARRQIDEVPALEETRKTTARSAKEQVEQLAPGTRGANQTFGNYLELRPNLERAARRIDDRDLFGMTDMFGVGTGIGIGTLVHPGLGTAIGTGIELFNNPRVSPYVARGIYQAGRGLRSPGAQTSLALPYFGGSLYYAGERGALED